MNLGLSIQAQAIVQILAGLPALVTVGYLDDERQMDASPAKMPAAWVSLDKAEQDEATTIVTWAVVLRAKRLAGLQRPTGERPVLELVESIIAALHGRRIANGAKPLAFAQAEYMEPLVESATYLIRFVTTIHTGRSVGPCPNP